MWKIRRFFERVGKIIRFIPVIWKSSEWDWNGLLEIIQHQLKELRSCLENNKHKGDAGHVRKIRMCELLINRLLEGNYCEYEKSQHDSKWGKLEMRFVPAEHNMSEALFDRKYARSSKEKEMEFKEIKRVWNHEEYMQKQDIEYLFYLMRKNLTSWWN